MRQGELFALEWSDFTEDLSEVFVRRNLTEWRGKIEVRDGKTDKSRRRIPLAPQTSACLKDHRARSLDRMDGRSLVFSSAKGTYLRKPNFHKRSFKPILARSGLTLRFHDLRHTMATLLLIANVHPKVVSERLGHASIETTLDVYSHCLPTLQESAVEAMSSVLATVWLQ